MTLLPDKVKQVFFLANKGALLQYEKVVKFEIEHNLSFMVSDLVYTFQMICFKGT